MKALCRAYILRIMSSIYLIQKSLIKNPANQLAEVKNPFNSD